jgi:hypothetical protein
LSIWLSFGLCGFGFSRGLFPELRLGVVSVGWCRGAIAAHVRSAREALDNALAVLMGRG